MTPRVTLLLAMLALAPALLAPPAAATDPVCTKYGACLTDPCTLLTDGCGPLPYMVQGCAFHAFWLRGALPLDGCAPTVTVSWCDVEWYGGHGLWSAHVTCTEVATLP